MGRITLETLGRRIVEKRAGAGIRAIAKEVGVSPATLSRVERGNLPDLDTFRKVCKWLSLDPGEVLGFQSSEAGSTPIHVHFRKDKTLDQETAEALAKMVLAAQRAMAFQEYGR